MFHAIHLLLLLPLLQEESGHVTEALLYIRRATPDKFRRYTIVAENSVGISRRDVELMLKGDGRLLQLSCFDATAAVP